MKLRASQVHEVYLASSKSNYIARTEYKKGFRKGLFLGFLYSILIVILIIALQ